MKKGSISLVLGALLLGTMVGVVWARPSHAPEAADITRKITIPAAFFQPIQDGQDDYNQGSAITCTGGTFAAPVVFPCLEAMTVKRITLSVRDQNASANACVEMHRTIPNVGNASDVLMATQCSGGSQPGVINYTDDAIDHALVRPAHGPYLWLRIFGTNISVYGVTIEYKRNI